MINTKLACIRANLEDLLKIVTDDNTIKNLVASTLELLDEAEVDYDIIAEQAADTEWLYEEIERLQDQVCNSD